MCKCTHVHINKNKYGNKIYLTYHNFFHCYYKSFMKQLLLLEYGIWGKLNQCSWVMAIPTLLRNKLSSCFLADESCVFVSAQLKELEEKAQSAVAMASSQACDRSCPKSFQPFETCFPKRMGKKTPLEADWPIGTWRLLHSYSGAFVRHTFHCVASAESCFVMSQPYPIT